MITYGQKWSSDDAAKDERRKKFERQLAFAKAVLPVILAHGVQINWDELDAMKAKLENPELGIKPPPSNPFYTGNPKVPQ